MPPNEMEFYHSLGELQGTVKAMQATQSLTNVQINQLEHRLSKEIDKLVNGMNQRISVLEADNGNNKLSIDRLKRVSKTHAALMGSAASFASVIVTEVIRGLWK